MDIIKYSKKLSTATTFRLPHSIMKAQRSSQMWSPSWCHCMASRLCTEFRCQDHRCPSYAQKTVFSCEPYCSSIRTALQLSVDVTESARVLCDIILGRQAKEVHGLTSREGSNHHESANANLLLKILHECVEIWHGTHPKMLVSVEEPHCPVIL